jgi:hypothetical protein
MKGITLDDKEIAALYLKLVNSPKDSNGRLIAQSKSGLKYVFNPGPVDKKFVLRFGLPKTLKQYAGTKYGTVRDTKSGELVPLGLSFDNFDNLEQAADFLKLALEDIRTFVDFVKTGDGTRFYI